MQHLSTGYKYTERLLFFLVTVTLFAFLSNSQIVTVFILLGLPHFMLSYVYQLRAGKHSILKIFLHSAILLALLILYRHEYFGILFSAAAIPFIFHFLLDERFLFKGHELPNFILEAGPIIVIYSGYILSALIGKWFIVPTLLITFVLLLLYLFFILMKKVKINEVSIYFLCGFLVLLGVIWLNPTISPVRLFGFVIIFHFINWYIFFLHKFREHKQVLNTYIKDVVVANLLILSIYIISLLGESILHITLGIIFLPWVYYIVAAMHIVSSVRAADYSTILSIE